MNILVCVKQVPGTSNVEVDPVTGVLKRSGVESKMNPYDLYALELGFKLVEKYGGEINVITMGPPQAKEILLEAIYMGAEKGCLITDRRFGGADVLATSYTLSQGIKKFGNFDLIICGKQTTDGDTAQVGPEISEFLKLSHMSNITEVLEVNDNSIILKAKEDNKNVTLKMPLPCLICADGDINTPRLPSYKRKKELPDYEVRIKTLTLDDLDDKNETNYGLKGSPTKVEKIFPPEKNTSKELFIDSSDVLTDKLINILVGKKFIQK